MTDGRFNVTLVKGLLFVPVYLAAPTPDGLLARLREVEAIPGKPTVPVMRPLVADYYSLPGNNVGGSLHVCLEDFNVGNDTVEFCIRTATDAGDECGIVLGRLLLRCSRTQRLKLAKGG